MQPEDRITYFAKTDARGSHTPFGIKSSDRSRHTYVIGKTGMGKSTLLENMAVQDIQNGEGLTFIDPHGSTAEKLLEYVPKDRAKDVLYFAPFDLSYPISFNVMEKVDPDKRHLVVNGLMSTFEKIWVDAWSARMAYILQNTLLALLEWPGATLLAVNRMYTDNNFRKQVVENVTDPSVRSFWVDEFAKYTDRFAAEATPAIQNKIGQFSSNALVRNIIGQPHSAFDLRKMMDEKKIFIVNLSKGRVGEGNANLLGSMLITKLYLAAMSRADTKGSAMHQLPPHYLYVDEFQSFANRSFADILSEARKYKLALTIAHQYIEQMEEEVRAAVFGNVGTMISFRVGAFDAEVLEKEFAPRFTVEDIVNLGARQIYLKLMIDGISSAPFSATTLPPIETPRETYEDMVIGYSRATYARPRAEVESEIREWHGALEDTGKSSPKKDGNREAANRKMSAKKKNDDRPPKETLKEQLQKVTGAEARDKKSDNTERAQKSNEKKESPASEPKESAGKEITTSNDDGQSLRAALGKIAKRFGDADEVKKESKAKEQASNADNAHSRRERTVSPDAAQSSKGESDKSSKSSKSSKADTSTPNKNVGGEKNALRSALQALVNQHKTPASSNVSKEKEPPYSSDASDRQPKAIKEDTAAHASPPPRKESDRQTTPAPDSVATHSTGEATWSASYAATEPDTRVTSPKELSRKSLEELFDVPYDPPTQ